MRKLIDLTGKTFGKITVIRYSHKNERNENYWYCRCECGNEYPVMGSNLRYNRVKQCDECSTKFKKLAYGEACFNSIYGNIKRGALTRNLVFDLSKDQVKKLILQPCYYCGEESSNYMIHSSVQNGKTYKSNGGIHYNGLDRVDNTKGYTIDNVVPCCKHCNSAKGKLTVDEFKSWVERISTYLKDKGWGSVEGSKME
jgi:5-methylcytosine-specific restriction endonuclease McrA